MPGGAKVTENYRAGRTWSAGVLSLEEDIARFHVAVDDFLGV